MPAKRIPTIIGIILTLLVLGISVLLVQLQTRFFSAASPSLFPKNVLITNYKPNQFSISWMTDEATTGFISYGSSESLGNIIFDKRDRESGKQGKYNYHYFTLSGLESGKKYFFKIGVNATLYGGRFAVSQNCQDYLDEIIEGGSFSFTLPAGSRAVTARAIPISGLVIKPDSLPAGGAVVCLQFEDIYPISDITSSSGSFIIPLTSILKKDNTILAQIPPQVLESILIFGPNRELTSGKVKSGNDHPIPPITIGVIFDYENKVPIISPTSMPTIPASSPTKGLPAVSIVPSVSPTPVFELTSPSGEVSDTLPTFRGKGKPGQILDIEVHSEENLSATIKVDENGFWTWTPPASLSPGEHTITIKTTDDLGKVNIITRTFQVLAVNPILPVSAGSPSAAVTQPTPTPTKIIIAQQLVTPTLKASPTSRINPTATPTYRPSPTLIPTNTPMPTVYIAPSVVPGEVPEAGNEFPYYLMFASGLLSLMCGLIIIYKRI